MERGLYQLGDFFSQLRNKADKFRSRCNVRRAMDEKINLREE